MTERKYCPECGESISVNAEICPKCGVRQRVAVEMKFCSSCGSSIVKNAEICPKCGVRQLYTAVKQVVNVSTNANTSPLVTGASEKSRLIAFLLCFFLGYIGAHHFYAGKTGLGIAMLLITVLTFGIGVVATGIWALIDMIMILTGDFKDSDGRKILNWS